MRQLSEGVRWISSEKNRTLRRARYETAAWRRRHRANRLKITAAIENAKRFLAVCKEFGTFDAYLWSFVGGTPIQNRWRRMAEVSARTAESDAMSRDLQRRGFKFVGSTICYALMQATGMVNDHLVTCPRHAQVSRLRRAGESSSSPTRQQSRASKASSQML
jgi:hypothetical protein